MRFGNHPFHFAILICVVCAGSASAQSPAPIAQSLSPGLIRSDEGGAHGYQHGVERSRFVTGPANADLRRDEKNGFSRVVGPDGVFATNLHNGLVIAVQSGGSNKDETKATDLEASSRYVLDPEKHNVQVVDYFVGAGVPRGQIGGVHATTYLSASGSRDEARPAPVKVDGYASILERKIENFPVVDSVAWARMNEQGNVVSEWVYWPAIRARDLADARRLEEASGKADFLTRLPAGLPKGRVVIRHSSATSEGPFESFASYDVLERRTSPNSSSVVTRHFDVDGIERRLPQERRSSGVDYPPKEERRR